MPEVVKVSTVETRQKLMATIEEYFKRGRYAEITQTIGIHSLLIESEHTIEDQAKLYRSVLNMIKAKLLEQLGRKYEGWYADFPQLMDKIVASGQIVTDKAASEMLASQRASYGRFLSVDEFYRWALDDRRLTLEQIVTYVNKTVDMYGR